MISDTAVNLIDSVRVKHISSGIATKWLSLIKFPNYEFLNMRNVFKFKTVEAQSRYLSADSTIILINFQRSDKFSVIPLMKAAIMRGLFRKSH